MCVLIDFLGSLWLNVLARGLHIAARTKVRSGECGICIALIFCFVGTNAQSARTSQSYIVHPTSYMGSRFAAAWGRRQFSPLRAAHPRCPYALTAVVRVVHRTSNIVHRQSLRGCLGSSPVFTPPGQKLRFWTNWLTAAGRFPRAGGSPNF